MASSGLLLIKVDTGQKAAFSRYNRYKGKSNRRFKIKNTPQKSGWGSEFATNLLVIV
jgi:hypothetical protein